MAHHRDLHKQNLLEIHTEMVDYNPDHSGLKFLYNQRPSAVYSEHIVSESVDIAGSVVVTVYKLCSMVFPGMGYSSCTQDNYIQIWFVLVVLCSYLYLCNYLLILKVLKI